MPAASVPPTAQVAAKWARRAGSAGEEYRMGVTGAGGRWAANAQAADANYRTGVTEAAGQGRFRSGVAKAGAAKYERGATEKGPGRYSQGVAVGEGDFATGIAPVLETIARTDLPARGTRGADGNIQRVAAIARALHQLRVGRK